MNNNSTTIALHHLHVLGHLFKELDNDALLKILEAGEKQQVEAGDYLFKQGDPENALYVVLSGRLRAVLQDKNGTNILGDIGEGEPTGEFALFTNEPRMASVLAIRKTIVLKINKQEYLNLVSQNPAFCRLVDQLPDQTFAAQHFRATHERHAKEYCAHQFAAGT